MSPFADMLVRWALDYPARRTEPFKGNDFAHWIRHDLAIVARDLIVDRAQPLRIKASAGIGQWTSVPWLGFFDERATLTARDGVYVVYLLAPELGTITLSLVHGTETLYRLHGPTEGRRMLLERAAAIAASLPQFHARFSTAPITLGSPADTPLNYEAGHAMGHTYTLCDLAMADLKADLNALLDAYNAFILLEKQGSTASTCSELR